MYLNLKLALTLLVLCSLPSFAQSKSSLEIQADSFFKNNEFKKARNLYSQLIKTDNGNLKYFYNRAICFYYNSEYVSAEKDLTYYINNSKDILQKLPIYLIRGHCFYFQEKPEKALDDYHIASTFSENDLELLFYSALCYYNLKKYDKCIFQINKLIKNHSLKKGDFIEAQKILARCHLEKNNESEAKLICNKMLIDDSTNVDMINMLSEIYYFKDYYDSSLVYSNQVLKIDPINLEAIFRKSLILFRKNDYKLSLNLLNKYTLLLKEKTGTDAYYYIAKCYEYIGNKQLALNNYMLNIKYNNNFAHAHNALAWYYFLNQKYNEALISVDKAISIDGNYANAIDTRACIYYKQGKYNKSILDFSKALSIDSTLYNSYYFRSLCYIKLNNIALACIDLNKIDENKYQILKSEKSIKQLLIDNNCNK